MAEVVCRLLTQMENRDFAVVILYQLQPLHQDAREEILLEQGGRAFLSCADTESLEQTPLERLRSPAGPHPPHGSGFGISMCV